MLKKGTLAIYSYKCKSRENRRKQNFEVTVGLRKGHDLAIRYLKRVDKFFGIQPSK
jgi:hypothetical protein